MKILLHGISEMFLPMFSSRTFMVSQLIFKSSINLEFISVYGVSFWSSFIFFACSYLDIPTPFVEEAIFYSILCFCPLYQILTDHRYLGKLLGSLFCSIDLCDCFSVNTRLFCLPWQCNIVWYQILSSFRLCSSLSKSLWLFMIIYGSMSIFEMLILCLWNMSLAF